METEHEITFSKKLWACGLLHDDPSILKSSAAFSFGRVGRWKLSLIPITFLEHAATHRPGVAVIAIRMPDMNGLEVQTRAREFRPQPGVIVLTSKRRSISSYEWQ